VLDPSTQIFKSQPCHYVNGTRAGCRSIEDLHDVFSGSGEEDAGLNEEDESSLAIAVPALWWCGGLKDTAYM
jgi:hypothetical protein